MFWSKLDKNSIKETVSPSHASFKLYYMFGVG